MRKIFFLVILSFFINTMAQNLYFDAFKDIKKAKKLINSNPQQAERLFIEAYSYLKQLVNSSIDNNKPSSNALNLLGELYLKGWGVRKNEKKAVKLLCAAKQLGNRKATKTLKKIGVKCQKINFKELKR